MSLVLTPPEPAERRHKRMALDNYPTPSWCVRRLVDAVPSIRAGGRFLEPTAGSGGIIRAAHDYGVRADWTAVELDERHIPALYELGAHLVEHETETRVSLGLSHRDFLDWERLHGAPGLFDLSLGNPPYSIALEVVQACLRVSANVCMLLRVGILESEERNAWIREHTPDLYVLPNRPAFQHGKTDSCVYAWHWWGARGQQQTEGRVRVLASTPLEERKRG